MLIASLQDRQKGNYLISDACLPGFAFELSLKSARDQEAEEFHHVAIVHHVDEDLTRLVRSPFASKHDPMGALRPAHASDLGGVETVHLVLLVVVVRLIENLEASGVRGAGNKPHVEIRSNSRQELSFCSEKCHRNRPATKMGG